MVCSNRNDNDGGGDILSILRHFSADFVESSLNVLHDGDTHALRTFPVEQE